jgi:hypothetical protein
VRCLQKQLNHEDMSRCVCVCVCVLVWGCNKSGCVVWLHSCAPRHTV